MDDIQSYLTTALGILSLTTLAGLGFLRGTVLNLREQVSDARNDAKTFKEARDEARAERAREQAEAAEDRLKLTQHVTECQAEIEVLRRTVTGEVHWVALGEQLEQVARQLSDLSTHLTTHAGALDRLQASAADHWKAEIEALVQIRQTQIEREARRDQS